MFPSFLISFKIYLFTMHGTFLWINNAVFVKANFSVVMHAIITACPQSKKTTQKVVRAHSLLRQKFTFMLAPSSDCYEYDPICRFVSDKDTFIFGFVKVLMVQ